MTNESATLKERTQPSKRQILEARGTRRRKRNQKIAAPSRQTKSKRAADQGEHETLDQKLANNLPARRSHRRADSEFAGPRGAARREQVGQICASDEENERDRAQQQVETIAVILHLIFQQLRHRHAHAGI